MYDVKINNIQNEYLIKRHSLFQNKITFLFILIYFIIFLYFFERHTCSISYSEVELTSNF